MTIGHIIQWVLCQKVVDSKDAAGPHIGETEKSSGSDARHICFSHVSVLLNEGWEHKLWGCSNLYNLGWSASLPYWWSFTETNATVGGPRHLVLWHCQITHCIHLHVQSLSPGVSNICKLYNPVSCWFCLHDTFFVSQEKIPQYWRLHVSHVCLARTWDKTYFSGRSFDGALLKDSSHTN